MAYVQKEPLEEVADAIRKLRWNDMMQLADHLAKAKLSDGDVASEWASILHNWSEDVFAVFVQRCKEDAR